MHTTRSDYTQSGGRPRPTVSQPNAPRTRPCQHARLQTPPRVTTNLLYLPTLLFLRSLDFILLSTTLYHSVPLCTTLYRSVVPLSTLCTTLYHAVCTCTSLYMYSV